MRIKAISVMMKKIRAKALFRQVEDPPEIKKVKARKRETKRERRT